jgi:hypothetical protein
MINDRLARLKAAAEEQATKSAGWTIKPDV